MRDSVKEQFYTGTQQKLSVELGMWLFLLTELMLFGAFLTAYANLRSLHPSAFFEASRHLDLKLASLNTFLLLSSSFFMAEAVRLADAGRRFRCLAALGVTLLLGAAFLGVKGLEYYNEWKEHLLPTPDFRFPLESLEREAKLFFTVYLVLTFTHALHLLTGLIWMLGLGLRELFVPDSLKAHPQTIECLGLYWHFVDIVWVFLFPLLYLVGGPT